MNRIELKARILALRIPARLRQTTYWLLGNLRGLIALLLQFLSRHLAFVESVLLGSLVALIVTNVPLIGRILAWAALTIGAFVGLLREARP
ncbi:MAG: hypothetical protein K8T26_11160 [Lentisphaerae bacterium]|nr:hypothetical protein [Lentisphaerota bacterium]